MRDPKRIDVILQKMGEIWKEVPDMRFFQFMHALSYSVLDDFNIEDLFYLEDEDFMVTINRLLKRKDEA